MIGLPESWAKYQSWSYEDKNFAKTLHLPQEIINQSSQQSWNPQLVHQCQSDHVSCMLCVFLPQSSSQEHSSKLTKEIVDLVDREAELLDRGMTEASLEGLQHSLNLLPSFAEWLPNLRFLLRRKIVSHSFISYQNLIQLLLARFLFRVSSLVLSCNIPVVSAKVDVTLNIT